MPMPFLERYAPYKALCIGVRGRAGGTERPSGLPYLLIAQLPQIFNKQYVDDKPLIFLLPN